MFVLAMLGCSSQTPVVEGTIGLVSPTGSSIDLYNEDGSLWYGFEIVHEESTGNEIIKDPNPEFHPYAFRLEYTPVYLRVVADHGLRYEVIANEMTGLRKFVRKGLSVRFQSWEEHILTTFSVRPRSGGNPIRETPAEDGKPVGTPDDILIEAAEFSGDWLKVKWESRNDTRGSEAIRGEGWIRWKEGDRLLITWFYFA